MQPHLSSRSGKLRPGGILHMATDWEDYAIGNDGIFKKNAEV